MGIFDPVVETEVTPPSPVATPAMPSAAGGFGQIFGGIVNAIGQAQRVAGSSGPSDDDVRREQERMRLLGWRDGLLEVSALRAEGREQEAIALERRVHANWLSDGGDINAESMAMYRTITGRDPGENGINIGMNPTEIAFNRARESDEYQQGLLASFSNLDADATQEDRDAFAMDFAAQQAAYNHVLASETAQWPAVEDALLARLDGFQSMLVGGLSATISSGGFVGQGDVERARLAVSNMRTELNAQFRGRAPSEADWATISAVFTSMESSLTALENLAGVEGIRRENLDRIARRLHESGGDPFVGNMLLDAAQNPGQYVEYFNQTEMWDDVQSFIYDTDWDDEGYRLGIDAASVVGSEGYDGSTVIPERAYNLLPEGADNLHGFIQDNITLLHGTSIEALSTPDGREVVAIALTRIYAAADHVSNDGRYMTSQDLSRFFGGQTLRRIDALAQHNADAAVGLLNMGQQALTRQLAGARQTFASVQAQLGFEMEMDARGRPLISREDALSLGLTEDTLDSISGGARFSEMPLEHFLRAFRDNPEVSSQMATLRSYQSLAESTAELTRLNRVYSNRVSDIRGERDIVQTADGLMGTMTPNGQYRPVHSNQEINLAIGPDAANLHPAFADGLTGLVNAARLAGVVVNINNSYRSPETQAALIADYWGLYDLNPADRERWLSDVEQYGPIAAGRMWETVFTNARRLSDGSAMRNWIALPGTSNHQHGLAADLSYGSADDMAWVHANASRFGLHFPLGNENWHVEVMGSRDGTLGAHQVGRFDGDSPVSVTAGLDQAIQDSRLGIQYREGLLDAMPAGAVPDDEAVAFNEAVAVDPDAALASDMMGSTEVGQLAEATAAAEARDEEERGIAAQQEAQALTASEVLDDNMMRQLRQLGGSELTPAYTSVEEASEAIRRGELRSGMAFVLNGQIRVYEEPDG